MRAGKMAPQIKELAAKPDDLSSIPVIHRMEERMILESCPLISTKAQWHIRSPSPNAF